MAVWAVAVWAVAVWAVAVWAVAVWAVAAWAVAAWAVAVWAVAVWAVAVWAVAGMKVPRLVGAVAGWVVKAVLAQAAMEPLPPQPAAVLRPALKAAAPQPALA